MTVDEVRSTFHTLTLHDAARFDAMARVVRQFQAEANPVYGRYAEVQTFLPVEAFKRAPITTFPPDEAEHVFTSSGTGRSVPSTHHVRDLSVYERSVTTHFEQVFGQGPFTLLAHLPHYSDRGERSSLVYMLDVLIRRYGDAASGFFLDDTHRLHEGIAHGQSTGTPLVLFGAAFGLLSLLEREGTVELPEDARILETGGMKTFRREISRSDLHARLAEGFGVPEAQVWSEYGMCELMSQCYTRGGHVFFPPPWMRFAVLDPQQPDRELDDGQAGALALIDLANVDTCAFLLTEDRAVRRGEGFEVLGRLTGAELRGCNFLLEA